MALELMLTGRRLGAAEAKALGLANRVVRAGPVMDEARAMARDIIAGAPLAVAATMELVRESRGRTLPEMHAALNAREFGAYEAMLASDDIKEGPKAFAEGRSPVWKGR
jgi:crotonobetainyl-CoA hydratase